MNMEIAPTPPGTGSLRPLEIADTTHTDFRLADGVDARQQLVVILGRADAIANSASLQEFLTGMLDLLAEITGADTAIYYRLDHGTDELVISVARGDEDYQHLIGLRLKRRDGMLSEPGSALQPIIVGDLPGDLPWMRAVDPHSAVRMQRIISLPLACKDRQIGVVQLFNYQRAELDLLELLQNRLANEIDHWTQLQESVRYNQRLMSLIDVIGEVAGTLDRSRLLHLVAENASRLVNAERSSVFLVDQSTNEMIFQIAYQLPDQSEPGRSTPLTGSTGNPGKTTHNSSPSNNSRPRMANRSQGDLSYFSRSAITVPIINGPLGKGSVEDPSHNLGALMALNQRGDGFQQEDAFLLSTLATQTSVFLQIAELYENSSELFLDTIKALVAAIDAKDPYTQGHSHRVSDYAVLISQELGLPAEQINDIRIGTLLHDVGKIGIPDEILQKKGYLTSQEFEIVKKHPITGANILSQVKMLEAVLPAVVEHHERLDGSGYPMGLRGEQISLLGRIVAVADVFDAMTSDRPYRKALSVAEVLDYLSLHTDSQFDANCVQALHRIITRSAPIE
jgi:putative nucleotidyltransferase with HDIG domain